MKGIRQLIVCCAILSLTQTLRSQGHIFPDKAYWFNCQYQLTLGTLSSKFVLVAITDLKCEESTYFIHLLHPILEKLPQIQLIQVLVADTGMALSRSELVHYTQLNNFNHPIAIFPDLNGFRGTKIQRLPYFLLYERSDLPVFTGEGYDGFYALTKYLNRLSNESERLDLAQRHQYLGIPAPKDFADPIIEYPTYFSEGMEGGFIINDAAHNRIIEVDKNGAYLRLLGTTMKGYADETLYSSHFWRPHGICREGSDIYVADTYNNRVRKIDLKTEMVSTLAGNGYYTNAAVKEVDGVHEPLGLPIDVAIMGGNLYVVSYSMGQIYKMDRQSGECEVLCTIPDSKKGLLISRPVNIIAGNEDLYVITNDGLAYVTDSKGKIKLLDPNLKWPVVAVCEYEEGLMGLTRDGYLIRYVNKKWEILGGKQNTSDKPNLLKLSGPSDMFESNGSLFICDSKAHRIKELTSSTDKMLKNFWLKCSPELIGFEAATSFGEISELDSLFMNGFDIKMTILLDLEGYQLVKSGQNEIISHDATGKVKLRSEVFNKPEISFELERDFSENDVYFELYMTLEKPEEPGLYLIKRAYIFLPIVQSKKSEMIQEQIYKPNLLPY